ncbi:MAG TPA: RNA 2',3'-cyclic phosphodiesterase [Bellilinea sp.]|nr:RNA 2',3'-cyclic phosphodiesterase [Bellilinea sp.]
MTLIRAFIAITLPSEIKTELESTIQKFKAQRVKGVRWVAVENIHLTLRFLGDTSPADLEQLTKLLQAESTAYHSFSAEVASVGAFPNSKRPRVIWVGFQAPAVLNELVASIESAARSIGIQPEERGFSPHLTLGRVKKDASPADILNLGAALKSIDVGSLDGFSVTHFTLFRSDLRPQGPLYSVLAQFNLQAAVH